MRRPVIQVHFSTGLTPIWRRCRKVSSMRLVSLIRPPRQNSTVPSPQVADSRKVLHPFYKGMLKSKGSMWEQRGGFKKFCHLGESQPAQSAAHKGVCLSLFLSLSLSCNGWSELIDFHGRIPSCPDTPSATK